MTKLPPSDDPARLHLECLAYDEGQRTALRELLSTLIRLAERQARRSEATARRAYAGDHERRQHGADVNLLEALSEVRQARG